MSASKELKNSGKDYGIFDSIDKALPGLAKGWAVFKDGLSGASSAMDVAKAAMSGLGAVISANPIMAVVTAVGLAATAHDALTVSAKEANENMQNSMSDYENSQSDLDNINSQLQDTQNSITDLQAKGNLTLIEKSELDKLKEANQELQVQADLKEKEVNKNAKKAAEDTVTAFNKNFKHKISKEATQKAFDSLEFNPSANLTGDAKDISSMIAGIEDYQNLAKKSLLGNDLESADKYAKLADSAKDSVWEQVEALNEYKSNLEALPYDQLNDKEKTALDTINDSIDYVYKALDPNKWKSLKLDEIFNQDRFANAKDALVDMAKQTNNVGVSVDQVKAKYPSLASAVEKAGVDIQDLVDNINSEAGIIDIDSVKNELKKAFNPDVDGASLTSLEKSKRDWDNFTKDFKDEDFEILYTIKQSNDTDGWSIEDWQEQYNLMKSDTQSTTSEPITFSSIMGDTEDGSLSKSIDDFQEKTSAVNTALQTLQEGGKLSSSDISDLIQQFPQLANETDNLRSALAGLNADNLSSILSSIDEQMEKVTSDSDKKAFQNLKDQLIDSVDLSGIDRSKVSKSLRNLFESNANDAVTRSFAKDQIANINKTFADELKTAEGKEIIYKLSLKPESINWDMSEWQSQFDEEFAKTSKNTLEKYVTQATNNLSALQTATSEASSTTGLTKSSIDSISQMFSGIPNFDADALFRNTADGVKLNTKALSSLLSVQHDIKATEFAKDIQKQTEAIKKQNDAVQEAKGTADFDTQQTKLKDMLASLTDMQQAQSQYHALYKQQQELFSDYGQWQQAQSTANAGDKYNNMVSGLQAAKDAWDKGLVGTDDFKSFAKLISPSGATDDVNFAENYAKAARYLTEDESGVKAFLNDLSSKGLADFNEESQQWSYNVKDMAEAAKQMGMGKEFMSNMFGRLEDYGFHNNVISDAEDGVLKLSDAYSNLAESEARLEDLKKNDPTNTTAIKQAEKEVSGYKQDIDELGTNLKEVASHTAENYNRELETAKNQMKTLADERERILKSNEYGDNTQAVADYMQSQIDQLGQSYGLDSSALQQQAEKAAKAYSDALQNATIENPVTPDFGEDTASADAYASAVDKVQQANKDNNQTLSDSIKTLQEYNSEQIKGIDLFDGAYDSDELKPAEQALDNICQSLGLTSEEAGLLGQVLESMGIIKPEVDDSDIEKAGETADTTSEKVQSLKDLQSSGDISSDIELDFDTADMSADELKSKIDELNGLKAEIDAEVNPEASAELDDLISKTETDYKIKVALDTDGQTPSELLDMAQNDEATFKAKFELDDSGYQEALSYLQDKDVEVKVNATLAQGADISSLLNMTDEDLSTTLNIDISQVDAARAELQSIQNGEITVPLTVKLEDSQFEAITNKNKDVTVTATVNGLPQITALDAALNKLHNKSVDVTANVNGTPETNALYSAIQRVNSKSVDVTANVSGTDAVNALVSAIAGVHSKTVTITSNHVTNNITNNIKGKGAQATGTMTSISRTRAYAFGSLDNFDFSPAYANGKISVDHDQVALMNELGMESRVRDGVWSLIPGGAHFENVKKDDIIFSAKQTQDLLKYGATSGHARAYAQGSLSDISLTHAFDGGSGWGGFGGGLANKTSVSSGSSDTPATQKHTDAVQKDTSATKSNTKSAKDSTETFDWVKVHLEKFSKAVERISNQITDYISSALKISLLKKQMKAIDKQIVAEQQGYDAYMNKANSIGISDDYKNKVINGTLSIEDIDTSTDEGKKLAKDVKNFQTYYNSAMDCKDSVQELNNKLLELYETLANMPTEKAEKAIDKLKSKYESFSNIGDAISTGGSAISILTKTIKTDNPKLATALTNQRKAQSERNKTKKIRSDASKNLKAEKNDIKKSGSKLLQASAKNVATSGKALKKVTKGNTDSATYNAIAQAVRNGTAVSLKGLKGNVLKEAKAYNKSLNID